jgi:hypothetical protein
MVRHTRPRRMDTPSMATKKKPAAKMPKTAAKKKGLAIAITLKGSPEWKAWVDRLADKFRTDTAKVIDMALVEFARTHGFEEAPRR